MTNEEFTEVVERRIKILKSTLISKGEEYGKTKDRLKNFKDAANLIECSNEEALLGFVAKHIIALKDFIHDQSAFNITREQWDEKIGDIIAYMVLLDGLLTERGI